ncbi:G-protein beta subunit-like protein containing WD repeats [Scheffersomyces xylosifermentans]|uniref:G-protein beta subunit-like protein containing WD repeats n=1 Tax=Scheffersomyces xylosifermentans TaxID=1304137 RepID=UPI00315DDD87
MVKPIDPVPVFTLRYHETSISNVVPSYVWNKHCLVSTDTKGWIVIWNINSKRPIKKWRGHNETILTVRFVNETDLMTHSRDSSLKIWDLTEEGEGQPPELFFLPVNSLNFSNVEYFDDCLVTPASVDSNNFDIYRIKACRPEYGFTRILTNFSPFDLYSKNKTEINSPNELGRNDFGIIMKFLYVEDERVLFLGFESGQIIGLKIDLNREPTVIDHGPPSPNNDKPLGLSGLSGLLKTPQQSSRTILNKDPKIEMIYSNSSHTPNPVISLIHTKDDRLISGSTNNRIMIHDYKNYSIDSVDGHLTSKKVSERGLQSIIYDETNDQLIIGYWNGIINGLPFNSLATSKRETATFQLKREIPRITVTTSNAAVDDQNEIRDTVKLTCLALLVAPDKKQIVNRRKSYKELVRARSGYVNDGSELLFSGYEDGAIVSYKIS